MMAFYVHQSAVRLKQQKIKIQLKLIRKLIQQN